MARAYPLMQVPRSLRHLFSEGGTGGLVRVPLFFGEPEAENLSPVGELTLYPRPPNGVLAAKAGVKIGLESVLRRYGQSITN